MKFIFSCCAQSDVLSLLSWERGLKFYYFIVVSDIKASLLSWERGLKSGGHRLKNILHNVAPLVGAWIEISTILRTFSIGISSLLSWERGLKYCWPCYFGLKARVAPLVGAWIEILQGFLLPHPHLSLLSWERGLKCLSHSLSGTR